MTMTIDARPVAGARDRRALLADLLRRKAAAEQITTQPLSRGQKALWFLHQSAPTSAAYHVAFAARIRSALDVTALRLALQALVDRHALLRATFRMQNGEPAQDIRGHREINLEISNCSGLTDECLHDRVVSAYKRPFDLEHGPLFRANLFVRATDDAVLLLTVHHIVYDGWSLWLNLDEFRQLYQAEMAGVEARLPPLSSTYHD
jgi:NRPS condensation-like uncharacterized protein